MTTVHWSGDSLYLCQEEQRQSILNEQTAFTFYSLIFGFVGPLAFILIFYVLVIIKLRSVGPRGQVSILFTICQRFEGICLAGEEPEQEEVPPKGDQVGPDRDHCLHHLLAAALGYSDCPHQVRKDLKA